MERGKQRLIIAAARASATYSAGFTAYTVTDSLHIAQRHIHQTFHHLHRWRRHIVRSHCHSDVHGASATIMTMVGTSVIAMATGFIMTAPHMATVGANGELRMLREMPQYITVTIMMMKL